MGSCLAARPASAQSILIKNVIPACAGMTEFLADVSTAPASLSIAGQHLPRTGEIKLGTIAVNDPYQERHPGAGRHPCNGPQIVLHSIRVQV